MKKIIQPLFLIFILVSTLGIFSLATSVERPHKVAKKPNIIFIFADDMGYGDVSSLNPRARTYTPHIDNLARKGIVFTNAHSSASVCTPSRYGFLTGRYAWRSDSGGKVVSGFGKPVIEEGRETIASLLKNDGYTTACIGKWHLGLDWQTKDGTSSVAYDPDTGTSNVDYKKKVKLGPNNYGFDYSYIHPASLDMPPYMFLRNHQPVDPEVVLTSEIYPDKLDDTEYSWDKKHTSENDVYWEKGVWWRRGEISQSFKVENCLTNILEEGISFIENYAKGKPREPFFMYLPLTGPHTPWMPTDQFKGKSSIDTYGDFVMNIDHVVGQVSETLRRLGIDDNTMLIFSSDNGAYWPQSEIDLYSHEANWGRRGQKGDVWDGGHRIPLIISWPARINERVAYKHLVSLTDLFATFGDLVNRKPQKNSGEDSFSFIHVLHGDTSKITRPSMIHQSSDGMFSIRMEGWKYVDGLGSGGFTAPTILDPIPGGPAGQLFQVTNDTLELSNLYLQHPEIVRKLQKELHHQTKKNVQ